ncbi:MAG: carboxypeptidase M32 [Thermoleophilia bacterium]
MTQAWTHFTQWCATLSDIGSAAALLGWDRETGMPPGGARARGAQLGTLAALHHRELVRPDMAGVLDELGADGGLDAARRRQVELITRDRHRAERVPETLVRAISEATSRSVTVWLEARPRADFAEFQPALTEVVRLKRELAECLSDGTGEHYDALLDMFEPGATAARLEPVFRDLGSRLTPLVAAGSARPAVGLPTVEWPADAQMALAHDVARLVGYDLRRGAITVSAHPFTSTAGMGDIRFTTRLDDASPVSNISSVLHEAGHAMYEQGFPDEFGRTPLFDAPSMGAHESQSRFWENHVGRLRAFWERIDPLLRMRFPAAMTSVTPDQLHAVGTTVRPSLIRVEADEVTYNLHITLRFELELALIRGDLEVAGLPSAWNRRIRELLDVTPPDDGVGVMQDIHWPEGLFGYFPTYTLGNLYAAQLAEAADAHLGGLPQAVADGRFEEILGFMRDRVHRHGNLVPTDELMLRATGSELNADALIRHLSVVSSGG